jgi:hypothetical protein
LSADPEVATVVRLVGDADAVADAVAPGGDRANFHDPGAPGFE